MHYRNDRQPRRIIAPFLGKSSSRWELGGRQPELFCRSSVIFLEGGPVITAGNYLKKSWLCPSLESKLRRARSLALCTYSSEHCWFLDAAVAQIMVCFPVPDYFYCQAQVGAVCRAVGPCPPEQYLSLWPCRWEELGQGREMLSSAGHCPLFPISAHGRWHMRSQVCPCVISLHSRGRTGMLVWGWYWGWWVAGLMRGHLAVRCRNICLSGTEGCRKR